MFIKIQRLATNSGHAQRPHQRPSVFKCIAFVVGLSSLFFLFGFTGVSYAAYCSCGANPCEPDDGCPPSGATNVVCGVKENAVGIEYGCTYTPYTPNWVRTYSCTSNMCQQSSGWCDANKNACRSTCSNNGDCDTTVYYTLTVNTNPSNGGSATGAGRYVSDTTVSADPTPNTGYNFSGWSGGCTSVNGTRCSVKMTGNKAITANFTAAPVVPQKYRLSLTKTGTGVGTVTSSPAGISCGTSCSSTSAEYNNGTNVTLTATVGGINTFGGWGGACSSRGKNTTCTVSMTAAQSVTARFDGANVTCALSVSPSSSGEVGDSFTFTARRTGGTATGTISYSNHSCSSLFGIGGGTIGGISGNTFRCTYNQPSGGTFNQNVGQIRINQGGVSGLCSLPITVTGTTPTPSGFHVDLVPNPSDGPVGSTFRFTATPRNIPTNLFGQPYTVSYSGHNCGGATANGTGNTFTCTYSSAGQKDASITATAQPSGIGWDPAQYATGTASVLVTAEEEPEIPDPPPPPPPPPAVSLDFFANPTTVVRGNSATLSWTVQNAANCVASNGWSGSKAAANGTHTERINNIQQNRNYTLRCSNGPRAETRTTTVSVKEPMSLTVEADPSWVRPGGNATISWTVSDAPGTPSCTLNGSSVTGTSETVGSINKVTKYTVSCTAGTGDQRETATGDTTVYVLPTFGEF